jgi:hypothetical protein
MDLRLKDNVGDGDEDWKTDKTEKEVVIFSPEAGDMMSVRNIDFYLRVCMASQLISTISSSPPSEHGITFYDVKLYIMDDTD